MYSIALGNVGEKGGRLYGPLCGPGSKGSEGSACLWQAGSEGGGIALSGDEYKVSVTGLAFCVIWNGKHSADWLAALASSYPAAPLDTPSV